MSNWQGWPQDEQTRTLLLRFFLDLARFKYAIKAGDFGEDRNGSYQPAWERLKEDMKGPPLPDGLKADHQYLWDSPPSKQTNRQKWRPIKPRDDWAFVIECVKTVRNNLFHGSKIPFRPNRDPELLRHCNQILMALATHCPEGIRRQFEAAA